MEEEFEYLFEDEFDALRDLDDGMDLDPVFICNIPLISSGTHCQWTVAVGHLLARCLVRYSLNSLSQLN